MLEHLYDPLAALDGMAASLAPGGTLNPPWIDFRDHGMFAGHHPLTYLTIPDVLLPRHDTQTRDGRTGSSCPRGATGSRTRRSRAH